jgi:hypothetical protein
LLSLLVLPFQQWLLTNVSLFHVSFYLAEHVLVDPKNLWRTLAPFSVYSAEGMKGANKDSKEKYKGFIVGIKVDPWDALGDGEEYDGFEYQACLLTKKSIVVDAPTRDFHEAGGDDDLIATMLNADKPEDEVLIDAFENATENANTAN